MAKPVEVRTETDNAESRDPAHILHAPDNYSGP
jgi:hypothetical protein